jgi:methanogenic corrinoid protein MtbC1
MTSHAVIVDPEQATLDAYLRLISDGDEYGAVGLVRDLVDTGVSPERVLLDVIAAAQRRVGDLWARNAWSVAREHAASAISERAVAAVAGRAEVGPVRGRVTLACVEGEWHSLPLRILAEVLTLRGWRVTFLGASVPDPHLVTHLDQTTTDGVALSCALPARLPRAHAMIRACHSMGVPVLAGGRGFGLDGRRARALGADGWAPTADLAADRIADGWPAPGGPVGGPVTDLPHLADGEYARLVRGRAGFVAAAMARLDGAYGPMAAYDERQREATADDLAHILDFLAAALYVDDAALFTEFVDWTTDVLLARGVPARALSVGLELFGEILVGFPRAGRILAAGHARCAA